MLNVRTSKELKEAIRIVAFNEGHSNSSKTVVNVLEKDPEIKKALTKVKSKKKVA